MTDLTAVELEGEGWRAQFRPCTIDRAPLAELASWAEQ
jgi:hypothetical protein